ncbi:MAG: hypothetical protein ACJAZN_002550, partial [Planctomycetota bacterium]
PRNGGLDKNAKLRVKLVQSATQEGSPVQAPQILSVDLQLGWTKVDLAELAGGAYALEVTLQSSQPSTVAMVSELMLGGPAADAPKNRSARHVGHAPFRSPWPHSPRS